MRQIVNKEMDNNVDERQMMAMLADTTTRRKAFGCLVSQYSERLYWQIRHIVLIHEDADDVLQNVFLKAWNALDTFKGSSKVYTWLSRIAINESLDFIRKQKTQATFSADEESDNVVRKLMADDYFDGNEADALLQEAIAALPDVQRTVFTLRYYEEMKYSDMSHILGTTEGGLKASYHIAVKKIKDYLEQHN